VPCSDAMPGGLERSGSHIAARDSSSHPIPVIHIRVPSPTCLTPCHLPDPHLCIRLDLFCSTLLREKGKGKERKCRINRDGRLMQKPSLFLSLTHIPFLRLNSLFSLPCAVCAVLHITPNTIPIVPRPFLFLLLSPLFV
jgi:hypothetical protein